MVVYINYITAAGNSNSSQLDSSFQGNQDGTEKAGGTARPSRTKSHLPGSLSSSQLDGLTFWASPLAFGLIGYIHTVRRCTYKRPFYFLKLIEQSYKLAKPQLEINIYDPPTPPTPPSPPPPTNWFDSGANSDININFLYVLMVGEAGTPSLHQREQ
jgi:hypothetical protein